MAGEKPRHPLAQSHTASLLRGGGAGREEAKGPRSSGFCSYRGWGHSRSSLLKLPRGHVTEGPPQESQLQAGRNSRPRTVSPQDCPPLPPHHCFGLQDNLPARQSAQSSLLSGCLLHPALPTPGLQTEVWTRSPHPLPPQAPEKANQGDSLSPPPLSGSLLSCPTESELGGRGARGQTPPQPTASPHSPALASCPADLAGPGRAEGTCSSGGP